MNESANAMEEKNKEKCPKCNSEKNSIHSWVSDSKNQKCVSQYLVCDDCKHIIKYFDEKDYDYSVFEYNYKNKELLTKIVTELKNKFPKDKVTIHTDGLLGGHFFQVTPKE